MTEDEARLKVGALLQHLREMRKLSQEEMADKLNIPRSAVSLIETGDRGIDFTELIEYAQTFKKHIDELVKPAMKKGAEAAAKPFNTVRFSVMSENQTQEVDAAALYAPISAAIEAATAMGITCHGVEKQGVLQQQEAAANLCRATIQIELPLNSQENKTCLETLVDNINLEFPGSQPTIETDINGMLGLHALSFLTMND